MVLPPKMPNNLRVHYYKYIFKFQFGQIKTIKKYKKLKYFEKYARL